MAERHPMSNLTSQAEGPAARLAVGWQDSIGGETTDAGKNTATLGED